jgi:hypothetical protein
MEPKQTRNLIDNRTDSNKSYRPSLQSSKHFLSSFLLLSFFFGLQLVDLHLGQLVPFTVDKLNICMLSVYPQSQQITIRKQEPKRRNKSFPFAVGWICSSIKPFSHNAYSVVFGANVATYVRVSGCDESKNSNASWHGVKPTSSPVKFLRHSARC